MKKKNIVLWLMLFLLFMSLFANIFIGAYKISLHQMWQAFFSDQEKMTWEVLYRLRFPRVLMSFLVGAAYGLSGTLMQALFKNPMADPSLIGVSSGASAGVVLFMLATSFWIEAEFIRYISIPISAFAGAMLTIFFIYKISTVYNKISVSIMLLSGIAINALLGALIGIFSYVSDDATLRSFTFWTLGSLNMSNYQNTALLFLILSFVFFFMLHKKSELNLLLLGEDEAKNSGVNIELLKKMIVVSVALAIGISVAYTGMIGFVGLVVPHISRLLVGANHNYLVPFSVLFGSFFMVWTDALARTVIAPAELPIGIITALFGAPFFLWLLFKSKKQII